VLHHRRRKAERISLLDIGALWVDEIVPFATGVLAGSPEE
jgi:hypothetical protein